MKVLLLVLLQILRQVRLGFVCAVLSVLTFSTNSFGWGGRGHDIICEAATFLVKEKGLKDYLTQRPQMMGHICNMPDFYWRSATPDSAKLGNPTHYIDVEITGLKADDISTDYAKVIKKFQGKENKWADKKGQKINSVPTEFGSLWWRADQFYRRAVALAGDLKTVKAPAGFKEEQDENFPYNKAVYDYVINIGLIGHFVGDASMPFHTTADYDGWGTGHGGIHAYYEDAGVAVQPYDLFSKVVEAGQKWQNDAASKEKSDREQVPFLLAKGVIPEMKALSVISTKESSDILALDPVIHASTIKKENGKEVRTPAVRESVEKVADAFGKYMAPEMGRSAALLAQMWDQSYVQVGRPKLNGYKLYKYPFTIDFIAPDYFDNTKELATLNAAKPVILQSPSPVPTVGK